MPNLPYQHPNGHNGNPNNGHPNNGNPNQGQAQSGNPLNTPRIDGDSWLEWGELDDGLQNDIPAAIPTPPVVAPPPTFQPRDQDELNAYYLHSLLCSLYSQLKPPQREAQGDLADTLRYLEEKDFTRAELVRRCLGMAAYLVDEAVATVNEVIDWPLIEALMCPEEAFWDSPQNWLAVGQAAAQSAVTQSGQAHGHDAETARGERAPPIKAPPIETWAEDTLSPITPPVTAPEVTPTTTPMPPALAALVASGLPSRAPTGASRRSFGRTLRTELETEKRRFYAIATRHGLPTGKEDGDNIRAALSELFGMEIKSRKDLTTRQWSLAASAIETEDLMWQTLVERKSPKTPQPRLHP